VFLLPYKKGAGIFGCYKKGWDLTEWGFSTPIKKASPGGKEVYRAGALIAKILLSDKEIMSY